MTVLNERRVCEKLKGSNTALTVGLTFERSKITAVDYSAFTHIPTLSSLSLSFNLLTEVPESLCTLPLCDLDLSHNKLNGDIGEHCRRLAKLSALQNLHLKGNTALPAYYRLALAHSMPYLRKLDGKTLSRDRSTANLIAGEARATAESEWASVQATSTSKVRAKKCWPSWIAAFRRDAKEGGKEAAFFNYWLGHWTKHLPDGKKVTQSHGNSQEKPSQKRVASPSATAAAGKRKRSGKAAAAAAVAAAAAAATAAVDGTKELLPAQGATSRQKMTKSPIKRKPISVGPRSEKRVAAVATSQSVVRRQKAAAPRGRKACAATGSDPFGERRIKSIQPISFFRAHRFSEAGAETEPEVWACAAPPPDAEMANVVATAGGSSVSFLDCGIGRIIAKYTHEREIFYTISWTVLTLPEKIVLVAAAGLQGDIKIVDYGQKKCILQVGGHTKAINALEFVRKGDPSCIISGSDDGVVRLTKIVAQEVSEGATGLNFAAHALRCFDTGAPVMSLATGLEGWYLAGLSDGHVWAWSKNGVSATRLLLALILITTLMVTKLLMSACFNVNVIFTFANHSPTWLATTENQLYSQKKQITHRNDRYFANND